MNTTDRCGEEKSVALRIVPVPLAVANDYVARHHRHHAPVVGHRFSIGCLHDNQLCGVAIMGRPVARMADDGWTLEVTRCCTDGTKNACSALYGACRRTAQAMGYARIITYTLLEEQGASLRGAGWKDEGLAAPPVWTRKERPGSGAKTVGRKRRWACTLHPVPEWSPSTERGQRDGQKELWEEVG